MRFAILAATLPLLANAGTIDLSGKVYDEAGKPVFGADVQLSRAGVYTASRPDGSWRILASVPDSGRAGLPDTLVYSLRGTEVERVFLPTWFQAGIGQVVQAAEEGDSPTGVEAACTERDTVPQEQGRYARQSVSHLGRLLLRGSARGLSADNSKVVLEQMQENLRLPRFDDNPLPASLVREFTRAANELGNPTDQELADLMDRLLVPRILQIVKLDALARAAGLQTADQRNSFVASKAKMPDVTGSQLLSVIRSAWIYIPVVNEVTLESTQDLATANVSMSILWFHIACDSATGKLRAKLEAAPSTMGFMMAKRNPKSFDPKAPEKFTFKSAVKTCVRQLLTQTKEMKAFNLSGQVVEKTGSSAAIDIGLRDGVLKNDQYYLMENVRGKDSVDRPTKVGWIRIYSREDSAKSWGRIISGKPYAGLALKEVSLSGLSIEPGYVSEPAKLELTPDLLWLGRGLDHDTAFAGSLTGVQLNAYYSTSWWYGFSWGIGVGYESGDFGAGKAVDFDISTWDFRAALRQSIPIYKRLGAYVEPYLAVRLTKGTLSENGKSGEENKAYNLQKGVDVGLELALFPSLNLRTRLGYSKFDADFEGADFNQAYNVNTHLRNDGLVFGFQLQWTPPALGFDPADALIGQMGPGM